MPANSNNSTSLYSFTPSTTVSTNNFTTLYNATPGNVTTANVPDRNFTTLYTKQSDISPTYPYGNSNVESFLNVGSDPGGNQVQNIVMFGNLNVGGQSNLGDVGNVHITGGNLNYILQTDGSGGLNWVALPTIPASNTTLYVHFDVVSTGNNQTFTNGSLVVYANSNTMAVMKNGINIQPSQYSISGNILTINIPLTTGDSIDVLPSTSGGGGSTPGGNLTDVQYNGGNTLSGNSSFTFDQANATLSVTNISTDTLAVNEIQTSNITVLSNLSVGDLSDLGNVGNVIITGGSAGQVLSTDGAGNLSWIAGGGGGTPAGSNTYVQYNNSGNFGASANFTFNSITNTLSATNIIGNVANANYSNFSGSATTAISANTAGTSIGANLANYAVNVTGNSQPNISSLGQLYNVTVGYSGFVDFTNTSNVSLGSVSNLHIDGGSGGQFLSTNGSGGLSWAAPAVANANYATYAGQLYDANGSAYIANTGALYIAGPNSSATITGTANVTIGTSYVFPTGYTNKWNFTTTGNLVLPGNTFAVNYANGTQVDLNGPVANANYANFAGNVVNATQSNITSVGTLTSLTVSGTSNVANTNFNKFNETVISGGSVSGTLTPDAAAGTIYEYTLTGNITLNNLSNAVTGTSMTIRLTQDGTGGRTLTSTMLFAGGTKTLSTAGSATDIISLYYNGTTYYAVLSKGYA